MVVVVSPTKACPEQVPILLILGPLANVAEVLTILNAASIVSVPFVNGDTDTSI